MSEVPGTAPEDIQLDPDQMEVDAVAPEETTQLGDKITILPGHAADMSAATFCLKEEDHTLGNSLRYMLMKNPQVEFCGYSNPHPSEAKIHLRVQMYDNESALKALSSAIRNLEDLFKTIAESYEADLTRGEYERYTEEEKTGTSRLREIVERGREVEQEKNARDKSGLVLP